MFTDLEKSTCRYATQEELGLITKVLLSISCIGDVIHVDAYM